MFAPNRKKKGPKTKPEKSSAFISNPALLKKARSPAERHRTKLRCVFYSQQVNLWLLFHTYKNLITDLVPVDAGRPIV
jgi:hypothetical protein